MLDYVVEFILDDDVFCKKRIWSDCTLNVSNCSDKVINELFDFDDMKDLNTCLTTHIVDSKYRQFKYIAETLFNGLRVYSNYLSFGSKDVDFSSFIDSLKYISLWYFQYGFPNDLSCDFIEKKRKEVIKLYNRRDFNISVIESIIDDSKDIERLRLKELREYFAKGGKKTGVFDVVKYTVDNVTDHRYFYLTDLPNTKVFDAFIVSTFFNNVEVQKARNSFYIYFSEVLDKVISKLS
jgi:hypothetical protein